MSTVSTLRVALRLSALAWLICVVAMVSACGGSGDDSSENGADLRTALAFLGSDQGFTDAQVACVAARVRRKIPRADVETFVAEATEVGSTGALESMDPARQTVLTEAIAGCVADG